MSRYGMPIHKFITKRNRPDPPPVVYRPHEGLQYPPAPRPGRYEVFAQEQFTIQPRTSFTAILKFGVIIRSGMVFVSLRQDLKIKRLSLQDGVVSETVDDIIVTIQNNSDVAVTINAGDSLCYVGRQL
jgi:hypothetical protein